MSSRTHYFQTQHHSPSQAQSQSQPQSHQHLRPLRQSHTIDFASNSNISPSLLNRFPSTTSSSASSGYSHASDHSLNSQYTSASSSAGYGATVHGHKRAQSDVRARAKTFEAGENMTSKKAPENIYSSARHSLRPLPQAPASTPPSTPPHAIPRHDRGKSVDIGKLSMAHIDGHSSPTKTSTSPIKTSPVKTSSPSRPLPMRPNSMLLTRSDSFLPPEATQAPSSPHHVHSTHIARDELEGLGKSSTSQLRTLSRLVSSDSPEDFTITSPAQEVVGLRGRRRLQRADRSNGGQSQKSTGYSWEGRNWMDKQRQFLQAYEYLCHIGEAKEWIEDVIHKSIPPIVELEEALRDGVTLAEVVEALNPDRRYRIFQHPRLQYRHSDNIAIFFRYLDEVELPDLFRFELIDLYEKKNIPKVIYCIHALSWLLFRKGIVDFRIGNLVGQLEFEHHELEAMQKGLDKLGVTMPSFGNMSADFGVPEPEPEPEETEEERIEKELRENEESIVDMQAQIRGALLRVKLGETMQTLWDEEEWLIDLQSRIRGDFTRQIMDYRLQMKRFAIQLQSSARGFLARRRLDRRDQILEALEPDILELQTMIRANKARNQVNREQQHLRSFGPQWKKLQAFARGFRARQDDMALKSELNKHSPAIEQLQALARGLCVRQNDQALRTELSQHAPAVERLQAFARGLRARQDDKTLRAELNKHTTGVEQLQAFARAAAVRRDVADTLDALKENEPAVIGLQGLIRAMLERQRVAAILEQLEEQEPQVTALQGNIRGFLYRQQHQAFLEELESHTPKIIDLQSILRAMMERARVEDIMAELEQEEECIVAFQTAARGFIVRARFEEKKRFYNENMQKVIKIQSFVRAKVQGEAYKSLTTGKNPPVNAVKNFVHLLNDSDFDFNEEIEFERIRKTVVQQVRQNEMLENYIDQLDIKIALLVKNKITLDEVVRHQHNYGGNSMHFIANSSMSSANQFDLKALNKSSRKKLESYQQLFFNLQTQPQYLARLFKRIREQGTAEKECKRIELLMMSLFGYAQKRREEYYLLKLIARSIREEIVSARDVQDFIRGNFFWSKLLNNYTRSPRDRKYLRDLLGPLIRDNIVEDPALDLESDPMQIYRSAINNTELATGRPDQRPLDVPREVAIRDPETRRLFIDHLRDLREICDQFFLALEDFLHKMPYGLRFVCNQIFENLRQQFKREPPENLLQVVSSWLWRFYLQPAVVAPENVGVIEKALSPLQKRNLSEVAKVISQIASGRPFGGENVYLQPLNAFVAESVERLHQITSDLIAVPDAERTFDIDEFNDLYAKNKPTLYIKMTDVFSIHNLVAAELQTMCPGRDDVLREIMHDLGSAKNNENEMNAAGSSDIHMFLTPKLHDVDDPEADVKALFMETKRCVLYIIRVQTGANLLDILVKPISPEDDHKWRMLLRDEFSVGSNTRGAYSDANMIDVTRMTYQELKRTALENIMRLEKLGRITKHNYYQDVLNAIALDIRTKSRRRVQRQRELEGVRMTLSNLHEKAKYLEQQRKSYDDYIESAMATLQNKKGRKKFLLPFTKQYNHQRELERSGRVPKFGSYKYSARALSEKGVLVSWSGINDFEKINMTISCDEVGVFSLEGSRGHIQIPGASALVPIEDLLQAQFEAHQFMTLFEGSLKLNVNLLLHLLYKKFYRTQ
ncbi:IQ domain-containing protein containing GTPase activating protein [Fusarium oxysporum f. sp. radicis-lycopersici 26381]|uniref:IQ domain-containing protein containing GTPase activating protein n=1 Tax=Fusarium oxysporum Fo47 TaxID=660027 RepID=W9L3L5_FUSOX|nr:IQ domain-containing protein containing GTPase activating protein [Fusarium oxysporum Fo47]EWZ88947.1 IQ domain-containing protein containing GTPase activating protein [Fusarium oxysporum f. sp. lycopersici MN25]EXL46418.1 IQ domain-containing protein containing GTPase activating protein [Fusarium oxysporum f. sp. radicis-lycopersici 26381]KAJ4274318.1 iqgap- protein [Fusarium oxysporum]